MTLPYSFIYSIWPLIILYLGFYSLYPFIKPYTGGYMAAVISTSVPAIVLMGTVIIHRFRRLSLPLVISIVGNALWGSYNIWNLYFDISQKIPKKIGAELLSFLNNLDWILICFYLSPIIAAIFGWRYWWSNTGSLSI